MASMCHCTPSASLMACLSTSSLPLLAKAVACAGTFIEADLQRLAVEAGDMGVVGQQHPGRAAAGSVAAAPRICGHIWRTRVGSPNPGASCPRRPLCLCLAWA